MAKKYKLPPGTWIERKLFENKAYLALKGFAPQLLTLFLAKRRFETVGNPGKQKRICVNSGSICFTYIEARKKYGVSIPRFYRAIDELLAKGFLTIIHQGGAYKQDKSIYGLSDNWMFWEPGITFEKQK
jgi:hypothetical protein